MLPAALPHFGSSALCLCIPLSLHVVAFSHKPSTRSFGKLRQPVSETFYWQRGSMPVSLGTLHCVPSTSKLTIERARRIKHSVSLIGIAPNTRGFRRSAYAQTHYDTLSLPHNANKGQIKVRPMLIPLCWISTHSRVV